MQDTNFGTTVHKRAFHNADQWEITVQSLYYERKMTYRVHKKYRLHEKKAYKGMGYFFFFRKSYFSAIIDKISSFSTKSKLEH